MTPTYKASRVFLGYVPLEEQVRDLVQRVSGVVGVVERALGVRIAALMVQGAGGDSEKLLFALGGRSP